MPSPAIAGVSTIKKPERHVSLLERGTDVLTAFDTLGNAVRGGLVSVATGKYRDPFSVYADKVTGEELLESIGIEPTFVKSLLAEILTDPLMLVGGIGSLTKVGKLAKGVKLARKQVKIFDKRARLEGVAGRLDNFKTESSLLQDALGALKSREFELAKLPKGTPLRSALVLKFPFRKKPLAELHLPQSIKDKLAVISKIQILPSTRALQISEDLKQTRSVLQSAQFEGKPKLIKQFQKNLADLLADQAKIEDDLLTKFGGSSEQALTIKRIKDNLAGGFRRFARDPTQALSQRITKSAVAGKIKKLHGSEIPLMLDSLDELRDAADLYKGVLGARIKGLADRAKQPVREFIDTNKEQVNQLYLAKLTQGREASKIGMGIVVPDAYVAWKSEIRTLKDKTKKLLKRANTPKRKQIITDSFVTKLEESIFKLDERELRLVEAKKIWGEITPQEKAFLTLHFDGLERFALQAQRIGIKVGPLQSSHDYLSWVPRIISEKALKIKGGTSTRHLNMMEDAKTYLSGSFARKGFPETDIDGINKIMRETHGIDFDFFETDIARIITLERAEHIKAFERAKAVNVLADLHKTKNKVSATDISTEKLFTAVNLDPKYAPKGFIPLSVFEDATNLDQFLKVGAAETAGAIMKFVAASNRVFQIGLTTFFPKFHHRNLLDNIFKMGLSGVKAKRIFPLQSRGYKLQTQAAKGELKGADIALWDRLLGGVVKTGQFDEYKANLTGPRAAVNAFETFLNKPINEIGILGHGAKAVKQSILKAKFWPRDWVDEFNDIIKKERPELNTLRPLSTKIDKIPKTPIPSAMGRNYGVFIEDNSRIVIYLDQLDKGATHIEALHKVNKYLFDPSEIGIAEKKFVRPTILFYTWMRNNIPLMINHSVRHPRFASVYSKLTSTDPAETPAFLRGSFAIPLGHNSYLGSLGIGIEDLKGFSVADADPSPNPIASVDQLRRLSERVMTRLAPAFKTPIELFLKGGSTFTRRRFEDQSLGKTIADLLPTSRFSNELSKLASDKTSIPTKIANFYLSTKIFQADSASVALAAFDRSNLAAGIAKRIPLVILRKDKLTDDRRKELNRIRSRLLRDLKKRKKGV